MTKDATQAKRKPLEDTMPEKRGGKGSPFLTPAQKLFCRLYLKYKEDHVKAALEVYPSMQNYASYGGDMVRNNPKIQHYLDYLREDAYETILDEAGRQRLSITARANEYLAMIKEARALGKFRDATELKGLLDKLVGRRRRHSINLSQYKNADEKRTVLQDATATGEIDHEDVKALSNTIKEDALGSVDCPVHVVIPGNERVKDD